MISCLKIPAIPHIFFSLFLLLFLFVTASAVDCQASGSGPASQAVVSPAEAELWQAAQAALASGEKQRAATLFNRFQQRFPQAAKAEEGLWQAARLYQEVALETKDPDWEPVRDLFRLFVAEYPESEQFQEAYLGLGLAHFRMHFFREALIYLNLFLERFSESELRPQALYWQGRTLAAIGRAQEAENKYQELATGTDRHYRLKAVETLGDLYFATARFHGALAYYQSLLQEFAPHTSKHLTIIRKVGLTNGRLEYETASRHDLYRYLNVTEDSPHLAEVLFELGESHWRQGELETASELYARALKIGQPKERAAVLSRFRLALYQNLHGEELPAWQRKKDDSTIAGDWPYRAVLDNHHREPIAQDARFTLLQRVMAREENEEAFHLAKGYLTYLEARDVNQKEVESILGGLLVGRVEQLLAEKEYQQVFALYQHENRHMAAYDQGNLYYLVGQALEALALYDQAAIIYYRAMARELSAAEKTDLYHRRAKVYLLQSDLASAERLLAFLRRIYQGQREVGEFYYLSGRLREAQGKIEEAVSFYNEGCRLPGLENRGNSCQAEVRVLLRLGRIQEADQAMADELRQLLLDRKAMQQLHGELGDAWRRHDSPELAAAAYLRGVGEEMEQQGERAQFLHLRLGDVSLELGRINQATAYYEQALSGPDDLLGKSAEKGRMQARIEQKVRNLHQPLNRTEADKAP